MSWQCFLIKSIRQTDWEPTEGGGRVRRGIMTLPDGREVEWKDLPVGAMWHSDMLPADSKYDGYVPTWYVLLPNNCAWPIQHKGTDGASWTMTGEPPNITTTPSINYVKRYHGWIKDGVISEDVDGRKFTQEGKLIP
jgi:hypothetical protein